MNITTLSDTLREWNALDAKSREMTLCLIEQQRVPAASSPSAIRKATTFLEGLRKRSEVEGDVGLAKMLRESTDAVMNDRDAFLALIK